MTIAIESDRSARRAASAKVDADRAKAIKKLLRPVRGDDSGPTPLTRIKHQPSSFERMLSSREITGEMLQAAQEIEAVYAALCGQLMVRGFRVERGSRGEAAPMAERVAFAHAKRFKPWADALSRRKVLHGDPTLACIVAVLVDRDSCTNCDRRHRMASGKSKYLVRRGLLEYAVVAGWARADLLAKLDNEHSKFVVKSRSLT